MLTEAVSVDLLLSSRHPLMKNGSQCFIHHCRRQRQSLLEGNDLKPDLTLENIPRVVRHFFIGESPSPVLTVWHVRPNEPSFLCNEVWKTPPAWGASFVWRQLMEGFSSVQDKKMENVLWMLMRRCPRTICSHAPPNQSASNYTETDRGFISPPTCSPHTQVEIESDRRVSPPIMGHSGG